MKVDKWVTDNGNDTYTITLEAYATGEKTITEETESIPADIILVLDQSGSMAHYMSYDFQLYTSDLRNERFYTLRHNGDGGQNLYHKLSNGHYAPVSVLRENIDRFNEYHFSYKNANYYYVYINERNLYRWNGQQFLNVTMYSWDDGDDYIYHYETPDGWWYQLRGADSNPRYFEGFGPLYYYSDTDVLYTYYYPGLYGNLEPIGESVGETTYPKFEFYERVATPNSATRISALKRAVAGTPATEDGFIQSIQKKAVGVDGIFGTNDDVNHRVAVVGFATGEYGQNNDVFTNTEVFVGETQYNYNDDAALHYADALQNMNTQNGYDNIVASINNLSTNGATYPNYGLAMAKGILDANPINSEEQRNRVVVLFTDGEPGYSSFDVGVANSAVNQARLLKNSGVTVYTVGIFDGADASADGVASGAPNRLANQFMHDVSSNNGTPSNLGYYLSASDTDTLSEIFQQISNQIEVGGSNTTLGADSLIMDYITPYFEFPEGTTSDSVILKTFAYKGDNQWEPNSNSMGATASIYDNAVSVTGFDFSANWCGTEEVNGVTHYRGNKLVVSFNVKRRSGFIGGNAVPTNDFAGVYQNNNANNPIILFPKPTVDLTIPEISISVPEKHIYLFQDVSAETLRSAKVKVGEGIFLDLNKYFDNSYGLYYWQYAFVDIEVVINDKDGNPIVSGLDDLIEDSQYTVYVKISPKHPGTTVDQTDEGTGEIYVYTPELTFKDGEIWYGGDIPSYQSLLNKKIDEKWQHGETLADTNTMGSAPSLELRFPTMQTFLESRIINTKQDVSVQVNVSIGEKNINNKTTFKHTPCEGKTCDPDGGYEFLLHNNTCKVTVKKEKGTVGEPYVFTLIKDGKPYSEVTIVGNDSKTIYELPIGTYTIAEDEQWSWRYQPNYTPAFTPDGTSNLNLNQIKGLVLSSDNPSGKIICTNNKTHDLWLNGYSQVEKNVYGATQ